jgi:hypothetical protein
MPKKRRNRHGFFRLDNPQSLHAQLSTVGKNGVIATPFCPPTTRYNEKQIPRSPPPLHA